MSALILRIVNREADLATYDAVAAALDFDRLHPLGLIMHGVSEVDGKYQVAQVWQSEEYALRFDEDVLKPVLEALGAPRDAEVRVFELHHLVTP